MYITGYMAQLPPLRSNNSSLYTHINLRSRDGTLFGYFLIRSSLHSVRLGQLLLCSHKRIVSIMKVYIERNNILVSGINLYDSVKNTDFILTLATLKWETFATDMVMNLGSLLSVMCRHHCSVQLWNSTVNR